MVVNSEPSHVSFSPNVQVLLLKLLCDLGAYKRKPRLARRKSHTAPQNLASAASSVPTPTQQSLPYGNIKHPPGVGFLDYMSPLHLSSCPLSNGTCPTAHCSTANQCIVNPRHYTLPCTPSVYQK